MILGVNAGFKEMCLHDIVSCNQSLENLPRDISAYIANTIYIIYDNTGEFGKVSGFEQE